MTSIIIADLINLLQQMSDEDYTKKIERLNQSTIGQHVRHSIEMYQSLLDNYQENEVDYSHRKRDILIESSSEYAITCFHKILVEINVDDKIIYVKNNEADLAALSSFNREVGYCNEHLIHHMAIIKVALQETNAYSISDSFGVAPSTIQYQTTLNK